MLFILISATIHSLRMWRSFLWLIGICSLLYKQTPPLGCSLASGESALNGSGENLFIYISLFSIFLLRKLSHIPKIWKLLQLCNASIWFILEPSLAKIEFRFQNPKWIFPFSCDIFGPGFFSISPDKISLSQKCIIKQCNRGNARGTSEACS